MMRVRITRRMNIVMRVRGRVRMPRPGLGSSGRKTEHEAQREGGI